MAASDIKSLPVSVVSSISDDALTLMSASSVNAMSTAQIQALSIDQINSLVNSPNYSKFSSAFQNSIKSSATGITSTITLKTSGAIFNSYSLINLEICLIISMRFLLNK